MINLAWMEVKSDGRFKLFDPGQAICRHALHVNFVGQLSFVVLRIFSLFFSFCSWKILKLYYEAAQPQNNGDILQGAIYIYIYLSLSLRTCNEAAGPRNSDKDLSSALSFGPAR